jgi:type IV pilus assembly protein PilA
MMKFNREEGLTLIELLITIAVLAIVAAIAVPVVTNVVNSTEDRAVAQTVSDIESFLNTASKSGTWAYDSATQTFTSYVDLDGNSKINTDGSELISELTIDSDLAKVTAGGVNVGATANTPSYDEAAAIDSVAIDTADDSVVNVTVGTDVKTFSVAEPAA